jgi:GNAT superfamily N-acetyltransferase
VEARIEPVARSHNRRAFDCGDQDLNEYLDRFARQNHELGGAATFVAVPPDEPTRVLGYYSIAPASIAFERLPAGLLPRLGRYPVPAFRLARLAVDRVAQGQGLGGDLLLDAGARALAVASQVGGVALLIDAKNERAAAWYRRQQASPLVDSQLEFILPLEAVRKLLEATRGPS